MRSAMHLSYSIAFSLFAAGVQQEKPHYRKKLRILIEKSFDEDGGHNDGDGNFSETGETMPLNLYYFGARYYDPDIGRWISVDLNEKDVFILNNPKGADFPLLPPLGHTAVIVGNDDLGYTFYSRDGKIAKDSYQGYSGLTQQLSAKTVEEILNSVDLAASENAGKNILIRERFGRMVQIKTSYEDDLEITGIMANMIDRDYDFTKENCSDLARYALEYLGIRLPDTYGTTASNVQFDLLQSLFGGSSDLSVNARMRNAGYDPYSGVKIADTPWNYDPMREKSHDAQGNYYDDDESDE